MNLKKYLLTLLIMLMIIPNNIVFAATGKEYADSVPVLTLKEVTEDSVSIYLTVPEYDSSEDIKLYCKIERREGEKGEYKEINGGESVECTTKSLFVDRNLKSDTKYYYRAMLTIGHKPSDVLCATTLSATIPKTTTSRTTTTTTTRIVEEPTTQIATQEVTEKVVDTGTTENVQTGVEDYAILGLSIIIITLISLIFIKRKNLFKKDL